VTPSQLVLELLYTFETLELETPFTKGPNEVENQLVKVKFILFPLGTSSSTYESALPSKE
jgi:hypothetical protein